MNELFRHIANEGQVITQIRNEFKDRGVFLTAHKAELIIKLKILKEIFLNKQ